jgi:hypothetical protein
MHGLGTAEAAKLFHHIGVSIGEDKYTAGTILATPGVISEQAVARKPTLMSDLQWAGRRLPWTPIIAMMLAINTPISGDP